MRRLNCFTRVTFYTSVVNKLTFTTSFIDDDAKQFIPLEIGLKFIRNRFDIHVFTKRFLTKFGWCFDFQIANTGFLYPHRCIFNNCFTHGMADAPLCLSNDLVS